VLYNQLLKLFPSGVRIANEDEPLVFGTRTDAKGNKRKWKEQSGEQYHVCCPICEEDRFRLYISYAWGLDHKEKFPTSKLVYCQNEQCHDKFDEDAPDRGNAQLWLKRKLNNVYLRKVEDGTIIIKPVVKERRVEQLVQFPKPEWSSPLDLLPENHPAVAYFRGRNFNPALLYKEWGCVYANQYPVQANGKDYSWLAGRVFIPTPGDGWQARLVSGESKLKYFSCPGWKKSEHLYGITKARQFGFMLLCEGVTDVWRVDGPAVAIFGKTLSNSQVMKIRKNWPVVGVLLDPDTETDSVNSMRRAMTQLAHADIKVFRVTLSGQKDAGDCTYDHLWDCIERSAATSGMGDLVRRPHA
jgi:hypothetical protein